MPPGVQGFALEVTDKCNYSCYFCVRDSHVQRNVFVAPSLVRSRAQRMRDLFPEISFVALTGGEPFLHPLLDGIIWVLSDLFAAITITTNGSVVNCTYLQAVAQIATPYIIVSLDGPDPGIHDAIRGSRGAFERLHRFLAALRDVDVPFGINITICRMNLAHISNTIDYALQLGPCDVSLSPARPAGRGVGCGLDHVDIKAIVKTFVTRHANSERVRMLEPLQHYYSTPPHSAPRGCNMDSGLLHITVDGDVKLCSSSIEYEGNIDTINGLKHGDLCRKIDAIRSRHHLMGVCGECAYKKACGGCRCRALQAVNNIYGDDPACEIVELMSR